MLPSRKMAGFNLAMAYNLWFERDNDQRNRAAAVDVEFSFRVIRRSGSRRGSLILALERSSGITRESCRVSKPMHLKRQMEEVEETTYLPSVYVRVVLSGIPRDQTTCRRVATFASVTTFRLLEQRI